MKKIINNIKLKIKVKLFNWAVNYVNKYQRSYGFPKKYVMYKADRVVILNQKSMCADIDNIETYINIAKQKLADTIQLEHMYVHANVSESNPNIAHIHARVTLIK